MWIQETDKVVLLYDHETVFFVLICWVMFAGRTCLHWACRLGHLEIIKLLVRQEIDVNKTDGMVS